VEPREVLKGLEESRDPGIAICKNFLAAKGLKLSDNPTAILGCCYAEASTSPEAQFVLASLLWTGVLGTVDRRAAAKWCLQAAGMGYAPAVTMLAGLSQIGAPGISKDLARAMQFLEEAADAGYAPALGYLATAYMDGVAVPQDTVKGLVYLRRAAEAGDAYSQSRLGSQLIESIDPATVTEGLAWLEAAARQNLASAHYALADLFAQGAAGIPANGDRAEQHRRAGHELEND
jgi:TPR repeat protein